MEAEYRKKIKALKLDNESILEWQKAAAAPDPVNSRYGC
jgi:hypothetical protein